MENIQQSETKNNSSARPKQKTGFARWWFGFQGSELLPIIPPDAKIAPGSDVKAGGKTPGQKRADGWWGFGGSWSKDIQATIEDAKAWKAMGASVGLQTRIFHAIDIDVEDGELACDLEFLANQILGPAPVRFRQGSQRRLLLYRIADGETPLRKHVAKFLIKSEKQAVELLGFGQQCVVEGAHPKGGVYEWREGHPCELGPSGLSPITAEKKDKFFTDVRALLTTYNYGLTQTGSTSAAGTRQSLDSPALWAPSPEVVIEALKAWRPEQMGHDEYVQALAGIKAALGPRRDEFRGEVLEWSPGVRSTEDDEFATRWNSITDSVLGWSWVEAQARAHGYDGGAQRVFDDGEAEGATEQQKIPEGALDRMLQRYVFVGSGIGQYYDVEHGTFLNSKELNARNVGVAAFGRSGIQSAEAEFQNHADARKVSIATYRPGQDVLIKDANNVDVRVPAVNLWRPSHVTPARDVTDDAVRPWLDHVVLIFGPLDGGAARHFFDWTAFILQRPGQKIGHALVLLGETQGTGKDTVFHPIFEAIGQHNVQKIDPEILNGQWTYFLKSQIVVLQEAMNFKRKEIGNKLKSYLTTPPMTLPINEKYIGQYMVPNIQNWVIFTNHEDALSLEETDRRHWIHRCCIEAPREDGYYDKLYAWYRSRGIELVTGWLLQRDISSFNPMARPPATAAKRDMMTHSMPKQTRWLREQLATSRFANRELIMTDELVSLKDDFQAPGGINQKHAASALKAEGFTPAKRIWFDDHTRQFWLRVGSKIPQTAEELRARFSAEVGNGGKNGAG